MDFGLADLLSVDAANVKVTKFKPKLKPKPKSNPKTLPEPKSTPAPPPTQPVEAADNGIIERTEEEQPFDVNQISINVNDDWQPSFEKPHEENAEPFVTLESLDDFLPQSTTVTDDLPPVSETPTIHVSMDENVEKEGPTEPDLESFEQIDPLTGEEASIFNDNEVFQDAENSLFLEPFDILSESRTVEGPKVGKFKPNRRAQTRKVENNHSLTSQIDYVDNTMFTPDEILGSSSIGIGITDSIPVPDFHVNEEPLAFTEADSVIPSEHLDPIPETPSVGHESVKKGKRQSSEPSLGRSSERLRRQSKKTLSLRDESDNDEIADDIIHGNEDNNNNNNNSIDDYMPENEPVSEGKGRRSKKPVNEKDRKRKKAGEVPVESTKVKKKFPHSSRRRNKRQVDPELLKIPEDQFEFHMHTIPMKELIRLAEHKERIAKKEASTSATPVLNQSGGSFSNIDQDEAYGQRTGSRNENGDFMEADNATYYNYRTHMKITPRMRWTKQDTELFYEAVQQFGTDLSMIKECFPGRTREQIKSKYKKEEKQHPLRLNDALTTRFKGNSHFEEVIKRLKEAQGEDSENEEDDPTNLTGDENEDDVATNIHENGETTKSVGSEKKDEEMEGDIPATGIGSPTKSHDSEDDMFRWDQYKSDI